MSKRYVCILSLLVFVLYTFCPVYVSADSNTQPAVCSWPTKWMNQYFDFQKEMKSVLLWSKINEKRYNASSEWGLFSNGILTFKKWNDRKEVHIPSNALDFLAWNILWDVKSFISNATTSAVLLLLASVSVVQWNTEWWAVLFKDRPIVRDYKTLLDIETQLFDVAYFRSKQVNLVSSLEWDMSKQLNEVIKKYVDSWLLEPTNRKIGDSVSMADVLMELVSMNAVMKHFILYPGISSLRSYNWCFDSSNEFCSNSTFVIKISFEAAKDLDDDYSWISMFWACNQYVSNFKSSLNKWWSNSKNSVDSSIKDITDAYERLVNALTNSKKSNWNRNKNKWRCDISDYEMAQLKSYRWSDWTCKEGFTNASFSYTKMKKAKKQQNKSVVTQTEQAASWSGSSASWSGSSENLFEQLKKKSTKQQKQGYWSEIYWIENLYNRNFSFDMAEELLSIYGWLNADYEQSYANAAASDFSYEYKKINWLIEEINVVNGSAKKLYDDLKAVGTYQCSS